jgi:hypothetical protein
MDLKIFNQINPSIQKIIIGYTIRKRSPKHLSKIKDSSVINWYLSIRKYNRNEITKLFRYKCTIGDLDIAKWMSEEFKIIKDDFVIELDDHHYYVFESTCLNGQLEVAKWFSSNYDLNKNTFGTWRTNIIFSNCCSEHNNLPIIKWLYETFDITKEHGSGGNIYYLFANICGYGDKYLSMVKWLYFTFNLSNDRMMICYDVTIPQIISNIRNNEKCTEVIAWLKSLPKL